MVLISWNVHITRGADEFFEVAEALYIQDGALLRIHSYRCFAPSTFTFRDVTFKTNHSVVATQECINIQFIFTLFFESTGFSCYFIEKSSANYPYNMLIFSKIAQKLC